MGFTLQNVTRGNFASSFFTDVAVATGYLSWRRGREGVPSGGNRRGCAVDDASTAR